MQIIFEEVWVVYGQQVSEFEYKDLDDTNFASDSSISNMPDMAGTLSISQNLVIYYLRECCKIDLLANFVVKAYLCSSCNTHTLEVLDCTFSRT